MEYSLYSFLILMVLLVLSIVHGANDASIDKTGVLLVRHESRSWRFLRLVFLSVIPASLFLLRGGRLSSFSQSILVLVLTIIIAICLGAIEEIASMAMIRKLAHRGVSWKEALALRKNAMSDYEELETIKEKRKQVEELQNKVLSEEELDRAIENLLTEHILACKEYTRAEHELAELEAKFMENARIL